MHLFAYVVHVLWLMSVVASMKLYNFRVPYSKAKFACQVLKLRLAQLTNQNKEHAMKAIFGITRGPATCWIDNYENLSPAGASNATVFHYFSNQCVGPASCDPSEYHYVLCE